MRMFVVSVLAGCSLAAIGLAIADQDENIGEYSQSLRQLEEALEAGDADTIRALIGPARAARSPYSPGYELRAFDAALAIHAGDFATAADEIEALEISLSIDSGVLECEMSAIIGRTSKDIAERVHPQMCAEYYLSYYKHPTFETLKKIARYWVIARNLRVVLRDATDA